MHRILLLVVALAVLLSACSQSETIDDRSVFEGCDAGFFSAAGVYGVVPNWTRLLSELEAGNRTVIADPSLSMLDLNDLLILEGGATPYCPRVEQYHEERLAKNDDPQDHDLLAQRVACAHLACDFERAVQVGNDAECEKLPVTVTGLRAHLGGLDYGQVSYELELRTACRFQVRRNKAVLALKSCDETAAWPGIDVNAFAHYCARQRSLT